MNHNPPSHTSPLEPRRVRGEASLHGYAGAPSQLQEGFWISLGWRVKKVHEANAEKKKLDRRIKGYLDEVRRLCLIEGVDWEEYLARNHIGLYKNEEGRYDVIITK